MIIIVMIVAQHGISQSPMAILDSIFIYKENDKVKANRILLTNQSHLLNQNNPVISSRFYNLKCELNNNEKIYADSALNFALVAKDSLSLAKAYNRLGVAYNAILENEKALESYRKVLQFPQFKEQVYVSYINSSNLFLDIDNFEDAKYYLGKAKALLPEIERIDQANFYSLNGYIYLNTEKLDSAKYYYTIALDISKEFKKERDILLYRENLGIIEHDLGNIELAENIFFEILDKAEKLEDKKLQLFVYTDLIYLYKDSKEFDNVIQMGLKQLQLAEETNLERYKLETSELLYQTFEQQKDYENALKFLKVYNAVSDSVTSTKNISGLTKIKVSDQFKEQHLIDSLQLANTSIKLTAEKHKRENVTWLLALALIASLISISQFLRTKKAQKRSDELLLNILPKTTANELKTGQTTTKRYDHVSILFADLKNFTAISSKLSPEQLVEMLDFYFCKFDSILKQWNVEKIKTIGDAYMAVYGIDKTYSSKTINIINAALSMQKFIKENQHDHIRNLTDHNLEMRIGIHTGSLVAGVVGKTKFQFDVWGDDVNIASRIESEGEAGKVNISIDTYERIKNSENLDFDARGSIKIKNRGEIEMYFVEAKVHGTEVVQQKSIGA